MNLNEYKNNFVKAVDFFKSDIASLRTGRATAAIVDSVQVEAYGTHSPLKAVATIMVADAKTLVIEPWDKGQLPAVEKGIRDAGLNINPINDGRVIRLILPDLTSDRRQELVKIMRQKQEQAKISVRKVREEAREMIALEEKENNISEDEKFKSQEELDKMVKSFNEEIEKIGATKEKEITTV